MNFWECCNKKYTIGIKKCRVCGSQQKTYGILPEPDSKAKRKVKASNQPKRQTTSRDPLIGPDDSPAVSTLVMQDGYKPATIQAREINTNE